MDNKNNCIICGAELEYFNSPKTIECELCHRIFQTNAACKNGHYICDKCHSTNAVELIRSVCGSTKSKNPIEIMRKLMAQPAVHMHGPGHHILVGAAIISAFHNCGGDVDLNAALDEMKNRGEQAPGGICGFWGCCGAAVSCGMAISIITGATPLSGQEWGLANLMTSEALERIAAIGGPRCCKRDSFTAVSAAAEFIEEKFGIRLEMPEKIICGFYPMNGQCLGDRCPFHP